jgi:hypothetical protein
LKATFLQGIKIASYSGRVSHARLDAANPEKYLYIMRASIDIGPFITQAFARDVPERRVDFGDSFLLLHNVRTRGPLLLGEIVKAKMTDLPDKVSRTTGVPVALGLRADEGIGRHAHFLYDGGIRTLLLQRDREVRHPAFREGVAVPANTDFILALIFKQDALQRLDRMRVLRKLSFKVARPQNADAFRGIDASAGYAIDLLSEHDGLFIDIDISVGRRKDVSLSRQAVLRVARGLFGRRGAEVRKVVVSGREEPGASTEMIDLFEDRLIYKGAADYQGRTLAPRECERILLEAHREHREYLQNYRHPE